MKRPSTHVAGDTGVANIMRAFVSAGWACDRVASDYGEDLIVQTVLAEQVDPFRTLVQVKSSSRVTPKGKKLPWRIGVEHALRWVKSSEPVLFIVWDLRRNRAWYAVPAEQYAEFELIVCESKTVQLNLQPLPPPTPEGLSKLGWMLRLRYYGIRMLTTQEQDRNHSLEHGDACDSKCSYKSALGAVVFEFFRATGVITKRGIASSVRIGSKNAKRNIGRKFYPKRLTNDDKINLEHETVMLALLGHLNSFTGIGIPTTILVIAAEYLQVLLRLKRS
jgi:hypothetical protein